MKPPTVPAFVRELLSDDNLDEAVAVTKEAMGIEPMDLLPDDACEQALRALVRELSPKTTHLCIDELREVTVLGGRNDPTTPGADAPWRALIFFMLCARQNLNAERAARAWYRTLADAALEADPPYEHRAFSIYVAGIVEAILGEDHWAEHWLITGQEEAQNYDDMASTFLGACRFVQTAQRRGS
jgi:hypothetical protein